MDGSKVLYFMVSSCLIFSFFFDFISIAHDMKHLNAIEISFRLFPFFFFLILQKAHSDPSEIFYA